MRENYLCTKAPETLRRTLSRCWQRSLPGLLGTCFALGAQAQQRPTPSFFADDAAAQRAAVGAPLKAVLRHSRPLTLNVANLRAALATAPFESQAGARPLLLALPLPDGTNARFEVREAPVMAPALAAQFPAIKTYAGVGLDDPTATVRLDLTPQGFHAQVLSPTTGAFYIDPVTRLNRTQVLSFWRRDMPGRTFDCGVTGESAKSSRPAGSRAQRTIASTLRTYRLAMAATGEYTAFHGGTVAAGQAAIVTTVNRVVGVYEREVDVRFVLVAGNSALVYTNAATDPYTNTSSDLAANQTTVDAAIGTGNYDIGHLVGTGGGGVAGLGVVCRAGNKARGLTGSPSPVGDAFDIDYVAHEMGHQCGGNHPFNGDGGSCAGGNRNASTAYEPGSGTTIMAYAGICGTANDLQPNSDPFFHVVSYEEIDTYLSSTTCAVTSSTGNTAPTLTVPASGKVLPISTPFKLTGTGADADGDALTYDWEEYDLGPQGSPTAAQVAGQSPPLFRSFSPTTSGTRYFPRLSNVIANTTVIGERLPTVTRALTFRLTVRDQHNGNQGVVGGLNSSPNVVLSSTSAAGPFVVTAPNTTVTLPSGSTQAVTWRVAGTDANGVNCATVNIRLSTDGGLTYPTLLLGNTPNDGSQDVTLPATPTTTARIMVEAADNYFYDISDANFAIAPPTACNAPTGLAVSSATTTSAVVSFTASTSATTSYTLTTSPASTTRTVTGSPVTLTGLMPSTPYTVYLVTNCQGGGTSVAASATFNTAQCNPATALAISNLTATSATVSFTGNATANTYTVTTSPASTTQTVTTSPVNLTGLTPGTTYTVSVVSSCNDGGTAPATLNFTTPPANDECAGAVSLTPNATCVTTSGNIAGATQSQAASTCNGAVSASATDEWYSFVATGATHTVRLTSTFDGVVQAFSGTCGSLTSLGCRDAAGAGTETLSLTGLTTNTRYYVRVYPYTEVAADIVTGTFTVCVTGTCSAPTSLAATNVTNTSATITFTSSTSQPATYTVTTSPATTTQVVSGSPVNLVGLTPGTAYTVSIVSNCNASFNSAAGTVIFTTSSIGDLVVSSAQAVSGTYNNVTVQSTGAATLAGNLNVNGVMTVQSGGSVQTSPTFKIQGPGRFVLDAGATLIETTGVGITNTGTGGFLLTGTNPVQLSTDANYVFAGTGAQVTGALLPARARNLTVNNSAGLTLTNNLAVAQVLRLQTGNLTLNAKSFLLPSSAAGTALVDNTGGVVLGNSASMQRAITGGVTGPAYRHYSSPVLTMAFDSLRTGGSSPVVNPAYNTSATPSTIMPFPTVFGYDQGRIATVTSTYGDFDKGWFTPTTINDAMQLNRGYTVNAPDTGVPVRFTGALNSGAQNSGSLDRGSSPDAGWQLLGNPYPSPLDWSSITTTQRPGVAGEMHVFQSTGRYAGTYRSYVNSIGSGSPIIEAGSGYFARVTATGTPGAVNLTNSNRITTFGPQNAFGRGTADVRPQLQLRVSSGALVDDAYLYTEAGATAGLDAEYDAQKLTNSTGLNLASLAGSKPLAIQGLPLLAGTTEVVVPLTLAAPAAGSFAFDVPTLANFGSTAVYLRDAEAGTQQLLTAGAHYAFALASATAGGARFALVLRPAGALATQAELRAALVSIFPNPAHGSFTLRLPPVAGQQAVQATLLTVLGQPVATRAIALTAAGATAEFDTRALAQGVYVLRLTAGSQTLTQRVVVQ